MINYSSLFVLLWSPSQKFFHYETLDQTTQTGIDTYFSDDRPQDYIVLAVGESREEIAAAHAELVAKKEENEDGEQDEAPNRRTRPSFISIHQGRWLGAL